MNTEVPIVVQKPFRQRTLRPTANYSFSVTIACLFWDGVIIVLCVMQTGLQGAPSIYQEKFKEAVVAFLHPEFQQYSRIFRALDCPMLTEFLPWLTGKHDRHFIAEALYFLIPIRDESINRRTYLF